MYYLFLDVAESIISRHGAVWQLLTGGRLGQQLGGRATKNSGVDVIGVRVELMSGYLFLHGGTWLERRLIFRMPTLFSFTARFTLENVTVCPAGQHGGVLYMRASDRIAERIADY